MCSKYRKQVTHQTHMTKTNPNGKLLLTKIFGGLIRLSWCRYICLSYCANLWRTQLENASQKLHALCLISTKLPSLCLSWMALFPREWQQLGFISPSDWNSFRGRRGRRTVNSSSSFRLFPPVEAITRRLILCTLSIYKLRGAYKMCEFILLPSVEVYQFLYFQYRNNSWHSSAAVIYLSFKLFTSPPH